MSKKVFRIDNLQYCKWSKEIFEINNEAKLDAVHVTVAYHENFDEVKKNMQVWNKHFQNYKDLSCNNNKNILIIEHSILTPDKDCGILSGITREKIIQLAHENGIALDEGKWPGEELFKADEIFLSGTVKKIIPVSTLDNYPVGNGKPGRITRKIMRLYLSLLENL